MQMYMEGLCANAEIKMWAIEIKHDDPFRLGFDWGIEQGIRDAHEMQ